MEVLLFQAVLIAAVLIAAVLIAAFLFYYLAFFSPFKGKNDPYSFPRGKQYRQYLPQRLSLMHALEQRTFEEVTIISFDGLELKGKYYHLDDTAPVDIFFHGYKGHALTGGCGFADIAFELGHNFLLVDERGCMGSQGHTISFGIKERHDVESWLNYIVSRFGEDKEINIFGISMGAATVLMAAGLTLPGNIKHMIADCPYSDAGEIIRKVCVDRKLPDAVLYPFIRLGARIFGGFDLTETNAAEAVKNCTVPILIIHGGKDGLIPAAMSEEIQKANPEYIRRAVFSEADHLMSQFVDRERYTALLKDFLRSEDAVQNDISFSVR